VRLLQLQLRPSVSRSSVLLEETHFQGFPRFCPFFFFFFFSNLVVKSFSRVVGAGAECGQIKSYRGRMSGRDEQFRSVARAAWRARRAKRFGGSFRRNERRNHLSLECNVVSEEDAVVANLERQIRLVLFVFFWL
jgi:hypothetical protein